ncbi:hypothetical protein [Frigoribacterium sp. UYMn621]|uniref:hypothetical protein n=1 Tax=Frigoribacterium sp. UYMn621 TaxID=3156343 RepID=UPI0033971147
MRAKSILGASTGALLVVLLAGCAGSSTNAGPTTRPSASPSPSASASTPAAPKDVLFTISANVRDKTGNTIAIELVAHNPLPYSDSGAKSLVNEFVSACGTGVGATPVTADTLAANGSILLQMDLASSTNGKQFVYPIDVTLGNVYFGQSVVGKGIAPTDTAHPCSSGFIWTTSGSGRAIADFESGNPGPDLTSWKYALYGFSVPADSQSTIEACKVTLTDAAKSTVADVAGWDPSQAATGYACTIGYVGE